MRPRAVIEQTVLIKPARYLYHRIKALRNSASQSNEAEIICELATDCPPTFIEFGFHPVQYNCVGLHKFLGLLIDADPKTIEIARWIMPKRICVQQQFLTLDAMHAIGRHHEALGVLSIDVDGNDYWFLKALLPFRPYVVSVEYNASFGREPISVPYDPSFERHSKHPSGWYHGASLSALAKLCAEHDMKLVRVSDSGVNAFFVRRENALPSLDPANAYRESTLRNGWSQTTAAEQWLRIRHMPFISI